MGGARRWNWTPDSAEMAEAGSQDWVEQDGGAVVLPRAGAVSPPRQRCCHSTAYPPGRVTVVGDPAPSCCIFAGPSMVVRQPSEWMEQRHGGLPFAVVWVLGPVDQLSSVHRCTLVVRAPTCMIRFESVPPGKWGWMVVNIPRRSGGTLGQGAACGWGVRKSSASNRPALGRPRAAGGGLVGFLCRIGARRSAVAEPDSPGRLGLPRGHSGCRSAGAGLPASTRLGGRTHWLARSGSCRSGGASRA